MRRVPAPTDDALTKVADLLRPIGAAIDSYAGIPVHRAQSALVGVLGNRVVFYVEFHAVRVKIEGERRTVNKMGRAWRDFAVPHTAGFLLPLYVPHILSPHGLAVSASAYSQRAEALSKRIVAAVPHAYALSAAGNVSTLGEWGDSYRILFSTRPWVLR